MKKMKATVVMWLFKLTQLSKRWHWDSNTSRATRPCSAPCKVWLHTTLSIFTMPLRIKQIVILIPTLGEEKLTLEGGSDLSKISHSTKGPN